MRVGFFLWRVAFFAWGAACLGALVAFAIHGRWGALTLFSGLLGLFCAMNYFQRHGPGTVRRGQVDYDRINRQEFELGIPFSSRPEPWRPPEVRTIGAAYLVFCPDCQYRSIGHTTEASARQRAAAHYREHLTGETVDG